MHFWLLEDFKHFFLTYPILKYLLKLGTGSQTYVCTEAVIQPVPLTEKPLPKWYSYFLPSASQGEFLKNKHNCLYFLMTTPESVCVSK